jgi:hypothetical protein
MYYQIKIQALFLLPEHFGFQLCELIQLIQIILDFQLLTNSFNFCDSMVTQISASASSLLSCLMFIFFSSFAINAHGEHLFCAEVILQ